MNSRLDFYNSKAWKRNRVAYAISRNCICERCGRAVYVSGVNDFLPKGRRIKYIVHHKVHLNDRNISDDSIAFDWNNLELLCIDCHNNEHTEQATRSNLMFDADGNLIERNKISRERTGR